MELVVLVDKHDNKIGVAEKMEAHIKGQLHRAFSVMIIRKTNSEYECLLQKRADDKYHCGKLWTNSCCSHPYDNEDIIDAASRRLKQELNISLSDFQKAGSFIYKAEFGNGLTEHEFDHVVVASWQEQKFTPNPDEVSATEWVSLSELPKIISTNPKLYTPWLLPVVERTIEFINQ